MLTETKAKLAVKYCSTKEKPTGKIICEKWHSFAEQRENLLIAMTG
jgi:hypothetical protein